MKFLLSIVVFVSLSFFACEKKKTNGADKIYTGPIMQIDNFVMNVTDSGRVRIKMSTAQELTYQNADKKYPKAVFVNFIDKEGVEYSSLRGDSARYIKDKNLYIIKGNVFFFNRKMQQSLATEELFWSPTEKKIYSKVRVKIKTPFENLTADGGMESDEDFTHYLLVKAKGVFMIDSLRTIVDTTNH